MVEDGCLDGRAIAPADARDELRRCGVWVKRFGPDFLHKGQLRYLWCGVELHPAKFAQVIKVQMRAIRKGQRHPRQAVGQLVEKAIVWVAAAPALLTNKEQLARHLEVHHQRVVGAQADEQHLSAALYRRDGRTVQEVRHRHRVVGEALG